MSAALTGSGGLGTMASGIGGKRHDGRAGDSSARPSPAMKLPM